MVPITGKAVQLGFTFPPEASVLREEVAESIKLADRAGARTAGALSGVVGTAARVGKQRSEPPDG